MKADEVHKMSDEEISQELDRLRQHTYELKSQAVTQKLEDPTQIQKARRDVARLMTEMNARRKAAKAEAK